MNSSFSFGIKAATEFFHLKEFRIIAKTQVYMRFCQHRHQQKLTDDKLLLDIHQMPYHTERQEMCDNFYKNMDKGLLMAQLFLTSIKCLTRQKKCEICDHLLEHVNE